MICKLKLELSTSAATAQSSTFRLPFANVSIARIADLKEMSAKAAAIAVDCGDLQLGDGLLALLRPALNELEPGGMLAVLSRATSVREDLASWCRAERHEYLG